jgi:hypothetical protein
MAALPVDSNWSAHPDEPQAVPDPLGGIRRACRSTSGETELGELYLPPGTRG